MFSVLCGNGKPQPVVNINQLCYFNSVEHKTISEKLICPPKQMHYAILPFLQLIGVSIAVFNLDISSELLIGTYSFSQKQKHCYDRLLDVLKVVW